MYKRKLEETHQTRSRCFRQFLPHLPPSKNTKDRPWCRNRVRRRQGLKNRLDYRPIASLSTELCDSSRNWLSSLRSQILPLRQSRQQRKPSLNLMSRSHLWYTAQIQCKMYSSWIQVESGVAWSRPRKRKEGSWVLCFLQTRTILPPHFSPRSPRKSKRKRQKPSNSGPVCEKLWRSAISSKCKESCLWSTTRTWLLNKTNPTHKSGSLRRSFLKKLTWLSKAPSSRSVIIQVARLTRW